MTQSQIAELAQRAIEAYNALLTRTRHDSPELLTAWRMAHQAWMDAAQIAPTPAPGPVATTNKPRGW